MARRMAGGTARFKNSTWGGCTLVEQGRRPYKRLLELIQVYQLGWASLEELEAGMARAATGASRPQKIKQADEGPLGRRRVRGGAMHAKSTRACRVIIPAEVNFASSA